MCGGVAGSQVKRWLVTRHRSVCWWGSVSAGGDEREHEPTADSEVTEVTVWPRRLRTLMFRALLKSLRAAFPRSIVSLSWSLVSMGLRCFWESSPGLSEGHGVTSDRLNPEDPGKGRGWSRWWERLGVWESLLPDPRPHADSWRSDLYHK